MCLNCPELRRKGGWLAPQTQVMHYSENGNYTREADKDQSIISVVDKSGLDIVSKWLRSGLG